MVSVVCCVQDQVWLFCGKTCCELFKRLSEIMALCDYCKLNKVLKDVSLTFENNPRTFCSEGGSLPFSLPHSLTLSLLLPLSLCVSVDIMSSKTLALNSFPVLCVLFPGCKLLFKHDLSKRLGQQCSTCAFCSNMSPQTIPNYFGGKVEEFCSKDCMSAYTVLFYEVRHTTLSSEKSTSVCTRTGQEATTAISGFDETRLDLA